jgi:hypothetical protein
MPITPKRGSFLHADSHGVGLVIVAVMADGPGLVFFILAALSAATAMHLRP